jgi:GTPase SAR1 family protein
MNVFSSLRHRVLLALALSATLIASGICVGAGPTPTPAAMPILSSSPNATSPGSSSLGGESTDQKTPLQKLWGGIYNICAKVPMPLWVFLGSAGLVFFVGLARRKGWLSQSQANALLELAQVKTKLEQEVKEKEAIKKEAIEHKERVEYLERRLSGPRFMATPQQEDRYCRMLLLGIGGVGKTHLIKSMMAAPGGEDYVPDPRVSTGTAKSYSLINAIVSGDNTKVVHVDVDDYRGQNQGELLRYLTERGADGKLHAVTAIVLVVDLFSPPDRDAPLQRTRPDWSASRVAKNNEEWSSAALQPWLDLAGDEWKYFCLFVNKLDLLRPLTNERIRDIEKEYDSLLQRAKQSRGVRYKIIVGSARRGTGVVELLSDLVEYSQRISYEGPAESSG